MINQLVVGVICFSIFSCVNHQQREVDEERINQYATTFSITENEDGYTIATKYDKFKLTRKNHTKTSIPIPLDSIAVTSTTFLGFITRLAEHHKVTVFPNPELIYNSGFEHVVNAGNETNWSHEVIINQKCNLVLTDFLEDESRIKVLQSAGIDVMVLPDYLEVSPLGRAEIMLLMGALFDKMELAKDRFFQVEKAYRAQMSPTIITKKKLVGGSLYGSTWFAPGGNSYLAEIYKDAGANYIYKSNSQKGSLKLSLEKIIQDTDSSTIWITSTKARSIQHIMHQDSRHQLLPFISTGQVYTAQKRVKGKANDYFETGYARPDLVLNDMRNILTGSSPDSLFFFKQLE